MKTEHKKFVWAGVTAFLLFLAIYYWEPFIHFVGLALRAASPLLLGCVVAYILNILMSFYERHYFPKTPKKAVRKSARPVCMIAAILTIIAVVVLVLRLVVPELINCVALLFEEVPKMMQSIAELLSKYELAPESVIKALLGFNWSGALSGVMNILKSGIGSTVSYAVGAVSSVVSGIMSGFIILIFVIYLLSGKEKLQRQLNSLFARYMKPAWHKKMQHVLSVANTCFHRYIVGQVTEAVILGTLCALGMLLFGFPYAVMIGAVVCVTALIPIAGAWIGGAVGFILILSVSPAKAFLFLVYLIVLQQLEGDLIYPRVVGTSIGLPGLWVLVAVTIGGGLAGIAGMLLGVPLCAAVYQLLRQDIHANGESPAVHTSHTS